VLLNMKNAGVLKDTATAIAISEIPHNISFEVRDLNHERYFTDWIVDQLPNYIGRVSGDLKIYTTLDADLQHYASLALQETLKKEGKDRNATQAALVTMRPDGAIQSLIGGVDYQKSQYNRATQALRQPGSAFKLFVYLAALQQGRTANSWVEDKPVRFGRWAPKNYSQEYRGELLLREAFFRSINTVAAQLAHDAGVDKVIAMARRLGITTPMKQDLSLSLGTSEVHLLELTGAYAHLAATGQQVIPYGITKVVNNEGDILYERKPSKGAAIISRNVARMMNDLLTDTVEYGTGKAASFGRPAAGKTGTSQNFRDAWFVGFTPQYVTGIWVGNDNNSPMKKVTGGSLPAHVWRDVMQYAHRDLPVKKIPQMFEYRSSEGENTQEELPWRPERDEFNPIRSIFDWFDSR
jgi:penicillin-binding protein 1A